VQPISANVPVASHQFFVLFTYLQLASLSTVRQNCRKEVIKLYYTLVCHKMTFSSFSLPTTVYCI